MHVKILFSIDEKTNAVKGFIYDDTNNYPIELKNAKGIQEHTLELESKETRYVTDYVKSHVELGKAKLTDIKELVD